MVWGDFTNAMSPYPKLNNENISSGGEVREVHSIKVNDSSINKETGKLYGTCLPWLGRTGSPV